MLTLFNIGGVIFLFLRIFACFLKENPLFIVTNDSWRRIYNKRGGNKYLLPPVQSGKTYGKAFGHEHFRSESNNDETGSKKLQPYKSKYYTSGKILAYIIIKPEVECY